MKRYPAKKKRDKRRNRKSIDILLFLLLAVFILSAVLFGIAAVYQYRHQAEPVIATPLFTDGDVQKMEEEQTEYEHTYYEIIKEDMDLLYQYKERNDETIGIITIRDTILHHPLMQSPTRGESFYLTHDLDRNHNFHGIPFLTLNSDLSRESGNNIIYGHNIIWTEPKDVFCDLVNYEDLDYYKSHPVIEIVTNEGTAKYIIFSYAIMDTADSDNFVYWEDVEWEDDASFNEYMSKMQERNWLNVDVPYNRYDAFITISTCSKELAHSGTNRMVIMARRLEVGEDYYKYIEGASMNPDPLLPRKLRGEK